MTRIAELEEELKATHDNYEEEIIVLVEKNDDLTRKLGVFIGDPAPGGEDDEPKEILLKTTSSSTTPTLTLMVVMMTMKTKLERILWSLLPINFSSRPPKQ